MRIFRERALISGIASLLLWGALPVAADPFEDAAGGDLRGIRRVYLGGGRIWVASPARQITLRAGVLRFRYSPTGEKIAYESVSVDHGEEIFAIKFVEPWRSEPTEKLVAKITEPAALNSDSRDAISLAGWSGDGRYLIVQRMKALDAVVSPADGSPASPPSFALTYERYDTLGDLSSPKIVSIGVVKPGSLPAFAWSPDHTQILVAVSVQDEQATEAGAATSHPSLTIYRPDDDSRRQVPITQDQGVRGWLDDHALLYRKRKSDVGGASQYLRHDLVSDAEETIPTLGDWPSAPEMSLGADLDEPSLVDPKSPGLMLEITPQTLPDTRRATNARASAIWLRNSMQTKKYSAAPLGVTPGGDSPKPQWSPVGDAVAFVAHGDLFVTDLVKQDATARERLDAGEHLDCKEETLIAATNLRQIGLGLLQYVQDYDDRLPPASRVQDRIYPYIQDASVFTLGDNKFVYRGNEKMLGSKFTSPSTFIIGEMDTPCAHNYVYMDGHVASTKK